MQVPVYAHEVYQSERAHIYEEKWLKEWYEKDKTCPECRKPLTTNEFKPNHLLRQEMDNFFRDNPHLRPKATMPKPSPASQATPDSSSEQHRIFRPLLF